MSWHSICEARSNIGGAAFDLEERHFVTWRADWRPWG